MISTMKKKLKYEAPVLTAVEFRTERGFAFSFAPASNEFTQALEQEVLMQLNSSTEFNAGQFTNVDQTNPSGSWVYTEEGTWF